MRKKRRSAYLLESLEARLLFSGDLAPLPVDGGTSGAEFESDLEISLQPDSAGVQEANENSQEHQEVIFVDSGVDDYQQLIDDIESQLEKGRQFDIVNLESNSDGIDQISAYLKQHEGIDAVHVVSHGSEDAVKLGNVWLTPDKLDAYADDIEGWQQALSSDADLLFYGCNLAAVDGGQDLVNSLTLLTGADVAASNDITGNAKFGGDWVLEYKSGEVEASVPFSVDLQANWSGLLNTFTVTTTTDGFAGSLRQAIIQANALGGSHTIVLDADTYTLSIGGAGEDAAATGDLDITADITITGVNAASTIIDASEFGATPDRVFHLIGPAANLTLTDLTIQGGSTVGDGGGILVDDPSAQLTATRVIVTGNLAGNGAGIFNRGTITLTDVEISNNGYAGTFEGGGIHNKEAATLNGVTLSGNRSDRGGGIHNDNTADTLSLTNVTISGNTAADTGGGLYNQNPATIVNTTFTLNTASTASGIFNDDAASEIDIRNTIVAGNLGCPDVEGDFNSLGNNLIGDKGAANGFTDGVNGDQAGTTGSSIDPLLGSLQNNGGFTQTHALLAGSPAIDAGDNSVGLTEDQRRYARPIDGDGDATLTIDIGAFEYTPLIVSHYLDGAGDGSDIPTAALKTTAPVDTTLDNFDPGRDVFAGLLLAGSDFGINEVDTTKYQQWLTLAGGTRLNGPASLSLWSTMKDFDITKAGSITAYLVDSDATGSTLTEIASATISRADWDVGNTGSWIEDTFDFGTVDYMLAAGRYLGVKIVVNNGLAADAMWLAYDVTTSPSRLTVTTVANNAPTATNLSSTSSYNEGDATVDIIDIVVTDVDSGETITAALTLNDISTGSLSANDGATYDGGTGVWTITDTVANVNLALANLVFNPLTNNDVDTTISVSIDDGDEDASGPLTGTITLDVTPPDITADLVVHLEFSEGSGTTAFDSTAYGNDAYLSGAQDWVSGAVGGGFHFDYSDGEDFFEINNAASVENVQEGSFTLAAWFKADNVPPASDAYGIIVKEGWHTGLWYNANKQFVFEHTLVGPSYPRVVSANTYDPGTYHHIAVTLDRPSGTMTLYIDGVLENTSSFTPGAASWEYNSETWKVGTARDMFPTSVDFPAKGSVDDVRIYSRAITAPESTELFNLGNSAPTVGGTYNFAGTDEDTTSMAVRISAILSDVSITANDVDGDTIGVAVYTQTGLGTWQYSTDGVGGWTAFGIISPNAALLLSETTWVRYVPDGTNGESVGFDFRAWDKSTDLASTNGTPRVGDTVPGGGTTAYSSGSASVALAVSSANDAPTATNLTSTSSYNEGDASVDITDIVVTDVDSGEMITATLTLDDITTGSLSANDGATYDGGTGVWTITDTVVNVNLALAKLVFTPLVNNDVDTTISTHIEDAAGAGPVDGTITLDVSPVNDPPTVVTNAPLNVPEEATRTITSAYLETTDPDNSPNQIIYTLTSLPNGGSVRLNGTALTLGQTFTQDDVNNNRVTYRDSDDGETTSFTLTVSDGNTTLPAFSFSINGQPINDAPVVSAPGSALNATEQIGLAIHGTGFSVSDLDEAGAGAIATLTVGEGTISVVVGNSGVSIDSGDGTGTVALSGSIAQLNTLLTGTSTGTIIYLNNSNTPSSNTTVTVTVNDQGNTGTDPGLTGDGSSEEGSNNVVINIASVNDEQVLAVNTGTTVNEASTANTITAAMLATTDVDNSATELVYTLSGVPANGTLYLSGTALSALDTFTQDDIDNGRVTYDHNDSETVSDSFAFSVDDGAGATSSDTFSITVTPVNDAGTVTIDNTTPAQGDPLTANVIDLDGISGAITYQWFSDGAVIGGATGKTYTTTQGDVGAVMTVTAIYTDDQGTAESLTSAPTAPVTNVNDTPIAVNDNLNAIEDQSMTFTSVTDLLGNDSDVDSDTLALSSFSQPANGSLADNGDGTVTYTSAGNFSGVDSFTYTISDNKGGTATGAAIIVVTPVGDTPQVMNVSTDAGVQSGLINIDRNSNDGAEVTHLKISGITNGTLYLADGVSRIDNGDFITVGQGQAGLRFTPAANSTADGSFNVESSEDGVSVASQSGIATSTISILTTAPQPSQPVPSPPPSFPEEVVSEETEQEESEDLEDVAEETEVQAIADDMASVEAPQHTKAPGIKKASLVPGISVFKRADLKSNNDRTPGRSTLFSPQTLKKLIESDNLGELKTALGKLNITTLPPDVYELVRGSLDAVQEEMGKEILIGKTVVGSAIATSVGLSAGYVVWMLKGGSLLASVLSSLPAWQLADPLAILVGTKEDEDEDDDTLETIIKDGSRRNEDKERNASESDKHKKESTKR